MTFATPIQNLIDDLKTTYGATSDAQLLEMFGCDHISELVSLKLLLDIKNK